MMRVAVLVDDCLGLELIFVMGFVLFVLGYLKVVFGIVESLMETFEMRFLERILCLFFGFDHSVRRMFVFE